MRKLTFCCVRARWQHAHQANPPKGRTKEGIETNDLCAAEPVAASSDPSAELDSTEDRNLRSADDREDEARAEAAGERAEAADERAEVTQERAEERADVQHSQLAVPADNTDVNERDTDDRALTPMDQGEGEAIARSPRTSARR